MKKFRITRSRGWNRPRNGFILTLSNFYPQFQFWVHSFLPSILLSIWSGPIVRKNLPSTSRYFPIFTNFTLNLSHFTPNTHCHSFYPQFQFKTLFTPSRWGPHPLSLPLRTLPSILPSVLILNYFHPSSQFSPLTWFLHSPVFPPNSPRVSNTPFLLPSSSP